MRKKYGLPKQEQTAKRYYQSEGVYMIYNEVILDSALFKKPLSQLDIPEYVLKANAYGPHSISYAWPNGRALLEKQVMEVLRKEPEDHIDFSCWNGEA